MIRVSVLFLLFVVLETNCETAHAVLAEFTDRATWNTAIGGAPDFAVTFNAIVTDASYNDPDTFDAGPFTLGSNGTDNRTQDPLNYVDASPFRVNTFSIDGSTVLSSRLGSDSTAITITFDEPISAFGADFARMFSDRVTLNLNRVGGGTDSKTLPTSATGDVTFYGVSDPSVAYESLSFTNSGSDKFWLMDNLSGLTAVPEPSSLLLAGAVSLGMWSRRRRRSAVA